MPELKGTKSIRLAAITIHSAAAITLKNLIFALRLACAAARSAAFCLMEYNLSSEVLIRITFLKHYIFERGFSACKQIVNLFCALFEYMADFADGKPVEVA